MRESFWDFHKLLSEEIERNYPGTEMFLVGGGDFISDCVMELREKKARYRYRPYELFRKGEEGDNYEKVMLEFLKEWENILRISEENG